MSNSYIFALEQNLLESLSQLDKPTLDHSYDYDSESEENDTSDHVLKSPGAITWFQSSIVPHPTKLGIYSCLLPSETTSLKSMQIGKDGKERTIAMLMIGGGHFAASIISLTASSLSNCVIRASKGFHRYTTRRKQGGSQAANDNAKGAAHSAGAQLRRYNEQALTEDIQSLLTEWKSMMDDCEVILIRASGQSNRKILFDSGLSKSDPRIRGFPINTRRATQSEIIRCFSILTRLQVSTIEEEKVPEIKQPIIKKEVPKEEPVDPKLVEQSEKLVSAIKRNKVPLLRTLLVEYNTTPSFVLQPKKSYLHTPSLLHVAASSDSSAVITFLLDEGADPTILNDEGKTAFEITSDRSSRDVFRIWRGKKENENKWDWIKARIPVGLTVEQLEARRLRDAEEKRIADEEEEKRRQIELERLAAEDKEKQRRAAEALEKKRGPGIQLNKLKGQSDAGMEGLTPEMRMKIEREKRARAAEARFKNSSR